jgi:outer membrane protein
VQGGADRSRWRRSACAFVGDGDLAGGCTGPQSATSHADGGRRGATRLGHHVGDRTTLELLNAENDAASAELALLQARIELAMNRLRLAAAAGRLDEAWLQSVNASLQAPGRR